MIRESVVNGRHLRRAVHCDAVAEYIVTITTVNREVLRGGKLVHEVVEQACQNSFLEINGADQPKRPQPEFGRASFPAIPRLNINAEFVHPPPNPTSSIMEYHDVAGEIRNG